MSYAYPMDSILSYDENGVPQYDRAINSAQLRTLYHELLSDGVLLNNSTNLQVVANSTMNVTVKAGLCNIQGCIKKFEEDINVTIESASTSYNRIDTIVARLDLNSDYRDIGIFVIKGTPASVPTRPELTRDTNVYEIALADITISANATTLSQSNISDTRLDTNRCGIISSIAQFDTTKLYEQIEADLVEFQNSNETEFEVWFERMKDQLGEDAAGNLQLQIDDVNEKVTEHIENTENPHGVTAEQTSIDNSASGLSANNVQGAIDEVSRTLGYTVSKNYLPNNKSTHTYMGVTFTVNKDKSVTVNGTGGVSNWTPLNLVGDFLNGGIEEIKGLIEDKEYVLSGCPEGGGDDNYQLFISLYDENNTPVTMYRDSGEGVKFTHRKGYQYQVFIGVKLNATVTNKTFYPMISVEGGEYEPYVADVGSRLDEKNLGNGGVLLGLTSLKATTTEQSHVIPNYNMYNALLVRISADNNNGSTIFIPRIIFGDVVPFSVNTTSIRGGSDYNLKIQGNVTSGVLYIHAITLSGWSNCKVYVWGIK